MCILIILVQSDDCHTLQSNWFLSPIMPWSHPTPLRNATSYEPRIAILGIWGDTWLTRGKYGIYVAVRGSYGALTGSTCICGTVLLGLGLGLSY